MAIGSRSGSSADLLVVGLGNPGEQYARTRHNAGRWVVEEFVQRHDGRLRRARRQQALVCELRLGERRVAAAAPVTWMNESGRAVAPLVRRFRIRDLSSLVVVHDELDLPVGRLKIKTGGGIAGHKGLQSVRAHLRSDSFTRVRIGVGRPDITPKGGDYVLKRPGRAERDELEAIVKRAADAIEHFLDHGLDPTMNRFNAT
ncbi:MAG: aminoacyl-tRNA hydrolase [Acidimicrobiaceae bacterium]|nr:aminoacyl-tRNA hydrolase [Acidimicrobiaceae bacterium]MDE0517423.1 aminoacyl-tRNA hydrolase [Acidimicrobiaceae bacterium]MDE0657460.1 aminoacyl-tRNA hydrolase [Acidimicrobiaceae bacterium]